MCLYHKRDMTGTGTMKDDEGWWRMMKDDEGWWRMMKDDEGWWRMMKDDEEWWRMMKDNEGWSGMCAFWFWLDLAVLSLSRLSCARRRTGFTGCGSAIRSTTPPQISLQKPCWIRHHILLMDAGSQRCPWFYHKSTKAWVVLARSCT